MYQISEHVASADATDYKSRLQRAAPDLPLFIAFLYVIFSGGIGARKTGFFDSFSTLENIPEFVLPL